MFIILISEYTIWLCIESLQFKKGRKKVAYMKAEYYGRELLPISF